jgi:Zn ribbon nucleic-acid-binding protein
MNCWAAFAFGLVFLLLGNCPAVAQEAASAPQQPIAFSHKTHAGTLKVACKGCHANPDPGEMMTIADAVSCMKCHSAIKTDSPEIQKLAGYAKSGTAIPWVRVYEVPSFVKFSHKTHLDKGATCQECHGQVATRDQLFRETNLSMSGCVDCHNAKKASVDCTLCHELQN